MIAEREAGIGRSDRFAMRDITGESARSIALNTATETDGRALRRMRNMAAVRGAVVELLSEGVELTIPRVATRAGVASRSVYRYYGDLEAAVRDAATSRLDDAIERVPELHDIDPTPPTAERINRVSRERVEMWRQAAPVLNHLPCDVVEGAMLRLDSAVLTTFAPELDRLASGLRPQAESVLAVIVRLRTIGTIADRCDDDLTETVAALRFAMRSVLTPQG